MIKSCPFCGKSERFLMMQWKHDLFTISCDCGRAEAAGSDQEVATNRWNERDVYLNPPDAQYLDRIRELDDSVESMTRQLSVVTASLNEANELIMRIGGNTCSHVAKHLGSLIPCK